MEVKDALRESFAKIKEDITALRQDVDLLKGENDELRRWSHKLYEHIQKLQARPEPKAGLQKEVLSKLEKHKKNIIKQRIFELLSQNTIPETKQKIVDEQKYCSKASFYRYVEDLKREGIIAKDAR